MAPEIFSDLETRTRARKEGVSLYGKEVDCWAIGVLAYEVLFGCVPWEFETHNREELVKHIRERGINFDPPGRKGPQRKRKEISDEAKSFISACLDVNRESRLTVHQMIRHPWIANNIIAAATGQDTDTGAMSGARVGGAPQARGASGGTHAALAVDGRCANRRQPFKSASIDPTSTNRIGFSVSSDRVNTRPDVGAVPAQSVNRQLRSQSFGVPPQNSRGQLAGGLQGLRIEEEAPGNERGSSYPLRYPSRSVGFNALRKARDALFGSFRLSRKPSMDKGDDNQHQ